MTDIPTAQTMRSLSAAKLRRARRLYFYLIFEDCWNNEALIPVAAKNAIKRGLYWHGASTRSVCFSIVTGMYKLYRKNNPDQYRGRYPWHDWWKDHNWLFKPWY